jgi:phosphatidylserine/phosphatidylglycerophosphate/cardiolipin synthase-like enzyme
MKENLKNIVLLFVLIFSAHLADAKTDVHFSKHGGCEKRVVGLIAHSKEFIDVAMYSLNNKKIIDALEKAKNNGVKIRILVDRLQGTGVNKKVTLALKHEGFDIRIHSKNKIQHNKFAIFDGKSIITGSFNWTESAENANEENCITLSAKKVVATYEDRFDKYLWVVNTEEKSQKAFEKLEDKVKSEENK